MTLILLYRLLSYLKRRTSPACKCQDSLTVKASLWLLNKWAFCHLDRCVWFVFMGKFYDIHKHGGMTIVTNNRLFSKSVISTNIHVDCHGVVRLIINLLNGLHYTKQLYDSLSTIADFIVTQWSHLMQTHLNKWTTNTLWNTKWTQLKMAGAVEFAKASFLHWATVLVLVLAVLVSSWMWRFSDSRFV